MIEEMVFYDKTMEMQGEKMNERGESGRGRA